MEGGSEKTQVNVAKGSVGGVEWGGGLLTVVMFKGERGDRN